KPVDVCGRHVNGIDIPRGMDVPRPEENAFAEVVVTKAPVSRQLALDSLQLGVPRFGAHLHVDLVVEDPARHRRAEGDPPAVPVVLLEERSHAVSSYAVVVGLAWATQGDVKVEPDALVPFYCRSLGDALQPDADGEVRRIARQSIREPPVVGRSAVYGAKPRYLSLSPPPFEGRRRVRAWSDPHIAAARGRGVRR